MKLWGKHEELSVSTIWIARHEFDKPKLTVVRRRIKRDTEIWNFLDEFYRKVAMCQPVEVRRRGLIRTLNCQISNAKLVAFFLYSAILKNQATQLRRPFTEIPRKSHKLQSNQTKHLRKCYWKIKRD